MEIKLNKKQLQALLEMVYAGNFALGSADEENEEIYNETESIIFDFAQKSGIDCAEYSEEYGGFLPSKKFEDSSRMEKKLQNFQELLFWSDLSHRLAIRDIAENVKTDDADLTFESIVERSEQYDQYFEEHGLDEIVATEMPPFAGPDTFRSLYFGTDELTDLNSNDNNE